MADRDPLADAVAGCVLRAEPTSGELGPVLVSTTTTAPTEPEREAALVTMHHTAVRLFTGMCRSVAFLPSPAAPADRRHPACPPARPPARSLLRALH